MSNKAEITKLSNKAIKSLSKMVNKKTFSRDENIIYKGNQPYYALVLLTGNILLKASRNKTITLTRGSLIGIKEVVQQGTFKFNTLIKSNSTALIINREIINEIINGSNHELARIFTHELR